MVQKYSLNWATFSEHLQLVFKDLYQEGRYTDVTLVSDDQTQFKAHKIVLSACSPVFKKIIDSNPSQHPLIYLRGIQSYELESILQFMYLGEARFYQEGMGEFIKVAKDLEVEGIIDGVELQNEEEEIVDDEIIAENDIEQTVKKENQIKVETKMRQQRTQSQLSNDNVEENSRNTKKKSKEEFRAAKRRLYRQASEAFKQGLFPSLNSCASAYNVSRKTLGRMITSNREYIGGGRKCRSSGNL